MSEQLRVLLLRDLKPVKGIPFGRQYLYHLVEQGKFPPPFKLGDQQNAWFEHEIDDWLIERAKKRGPTPATKARADHARAQKKPDTKRKRKKVPAEEVTVPRGRIRERGLWR
jgi:prophage regulatory protein